MKRFISNKYTLFVLGLIFLLVLWFILSLCFDHNTIIFPSPIDTFKSVGEYLIKPKTYADIGSSLLKMAIGFGISFVLAFALGIIVEDNPHLYSFFNPLVSTFKTIPTASVVFLFIVLSGARYAPIYVVILICFPILYESIVGGFKNINPQIIFATKVDGATYIRSLFKVKLPLSMPHIIVGISSSFALSFKIEIMAEIIAGDTHSGLGVAIKSAQTQNVADMTPVFALSFIAVVLMLGLSLINMRIKKTLS